MLAALYTLQGLYVAALYVYTVHGLHVVKLCYDDKMVYDGYMLLYYRYIKDCVMMAR